MMMILLLIIILFHTFAYSNTHGKGASQSVLQRPVSTRNKADKDTWTGCLSTVLATGTIPEGVKQNPAV